MPALSNMPCTRHIALVADANFSIPLALALYSLQRVLNEGNHYHIHILDGGIDRHQLAKLSEEGSPLHISYYPIEQELKSLPSAGRFPRSIYYRYLLPEILDASIERILYLDSDIIFLRDPEELWDIELGDAPLAACPWRIFGSYREKYAPYISNFPQRMGISAPTPPQEYYYSSMLMMNLKVMREEKTCQQLLDFTESHAEQLIWPDQDAINAILAGRIRELPQHCNVIPLFAADISKESPAAQAAYAQASIIHFAATKPNILRGAQYPYEEQFFQLWQESPWKRQIPYPLVSTYGMNKFLKAILLAPIKLFIEHPRILQAYGKILNTIRPKRREN